MFIPHGPAATAVARDASYLLSTAYLKHNAFKWLAKCIVLKLVDMQYAT